jgi:NADH-quinone oxidoreductase subunit H
LRGHGRRDQPGPFDLPEAEGELVGGFHTEYSSLKFALFFLAEYINMVTVSAIAVDAVPRRLARPWPISLWDGANENWWPILWWLGKVGVLLFMFVWLRGTLPRLRYDQFMKLGWKILIPMALAWTVLVATMRALSRDTGLADDRRAIYLGVAVVFGLVS